MKLKSDKITDNMRLTIWIYDEKGTWISCIQLRLWRNFTKNRYVVCMDMHGFGKV